MKWAGLITILFMVSRMPVIAYEFNSLPYGWKVLDGIDTNAESIFHAGNTKQFIKQVDIIPIILGTKERCLSTQLTTNPTYVVSMPDHVSSWWNTNSWLKDVPDYSITYVTAGRYVGTNYPITLGYYGNDSAWRVNYQNYWPSTTGVPIAISYTSGVLPTAIDYAAGWTATGGWIWAQETNVETNLIRTIVSTSGWFIITTECYAVSSDIFTNITISNSHVDITNAIGWYVEESLVANFDSFIKLLITNYPDVSTVYEDTTNLTMLTVTGLFSSLGIGNGLNQFTTVPCWTNPVQTNYHICYTSYWPTNGATFPTTNNYTSSYNQVVNYGKSWTEAGGVIWASMSNWPSEVVRITNAAVYGDYSGYQIYPINLEEKYKVLEALKKTNYVWHTVTTSIIQNTISGVGVGGIGVVHYSDREFYSTGTYASNDYYVYSAIFLSLWPENIGSSYDFPKNYSYVSYFKDTSGRVTFHMKRFAVESYLRLGPFNTNIPHSCIVSARSVCVDAGCYTNDFTTQGVFSPNENEWVNIIDVENSINEYEQSAVYGSTNGPSWVDRPLWELTDYYVSCRGNDSEIGYTACYVPDSVRSYTTNTFTNFYPSQANLWDGNYIYCTNKYW
ncbi:MAG: hypothetical protein PHW65_00025 [Dehalococcoidales bacterium]|nr:hypothetical protein [Dehalococcoidales bacterium]